MENKLAILRGRQNENNAIISSVPYFIGRCKTANFIIAHVNVSRNHCQIVIENGLWKINDFSSSGTFVNGTLVGKEHSAILNNGDSIRFGPVESNLCWTFCSFSCPSENALDVRTEPQAVLDNCNENCTLNDNRSPSKVLYLCDKLEDTINEGQQSVLKTSEVKQLQSTNKIKLSENEEKKEIEIEVSEKSQNLGEDSSIMREGNDKGESEKKKIQELTKELQQIQNALSDLEKKNDDLQGKLATEVRNNNENSGSSNLVENLTDLLETELQCTICSELFVTAVTLNCTHTFCKYCIDLWKRKQKTCPICRKKITNETKSLVVDNYIDKVVENLSSELKLRREAVIKERSDIGPVKKRPKVKN